jgi:uncharacterized membrane protein
MEPRVFQGAIRALQRLTTLIQKMELAPAIMNAARHLVVVKAPVDRVYGQWSRVEDLPKFIPALREVRRIDDTHFSYKWHRNGDGQQGLFHIILQIPGRRIAWRTLSNGFISGMVSFEPISQEETEVTLKIRSIFDPPSLSYRVEEYLGNFKRLVECEAGTQ